jgi:hypothetical protein
MAERKQPWQLKGPFAHLFATFYNHPKVMRAALDNPGAVGMYALSLSYSIDQRSDGFIPGYQADRLVPGLTAEQSADLTAILVKHRLWDQVSGGFQVHDWLDHNPSAEYLKGKSELGRRAADARWDKERNAERIADRNAEEDVDSDADKEWGRRPARRGGNLVCYFCHEAGHVMAACPKNPKSDAYKQAQKAKPDFVGIQ